MAKKDSERILEIREKANAQRREQQRREKRNTLFVQLGIAVAVLAIVGAVVAFVVMQNNSRVLEPGASAQGTVSLSGTDNIPLVVGDNAVTLGEKAAPVTIDLYEDYSCPHCADYAAEVGPTLLSLVAAGDAVVNYHPIRIVTNYGVAGGSAATCVAAKNPQNWPDFHAALFANHSQQTDGWGASDFADFAKKQGITDKDTISCIKQGAYADWIFSNTLASKEAGVTGTPTLFINGTMQEQLLSSSGLMDAVKALKGN
ncbi:MAG: thioredoxin domain-containing protein [Terrimesophilobacter sp.]